MVFHPTPAAEAESMSAVEAIRRAAAGRHHPAP
jgi:hypothetical protein